MEAVSAKVTSKGQITLPAKLRRRLGIKPGDKVEFVEGESGNVEIVARRKKLADLRGIIPLNGPAPSDEEIARWVEEARTARAMPAAPGLDSDE